MKKINVANNKGITLIALIITIVVLMILSATVVINFDTGKDIKEYNYMCADIELLQNKILTYYTNNNKTLPVLGTAIENVNLSGQASSKDNDNYYLIDLSKLYNITLNYGGGTVDNRDIYVVNEQSLRVYYLKGVVFENSTYYAPFKAATSGSSGSDGESGVEPEPPEPTNNIPVITSVALNSKTTNSFTVDALATDSDGENLTYSLYIVGENEAKDTEESAQGETVQLTAESLSMYTDYTYYVTVTDNTAEDESEQGTVKTKCSGTTTECIVAQCTSGGTKTCSKCSGSGKCVTCGGDGLTECRHSSYSTADMPDLTPLYCRYCSQQMTWCEGKGTCRTCGHYWPLDTGGNAFTDVCDECGWTASRTNYTSISCSSCSSQSRKMQYM